MSLFWCFTVVCFIHSYIMPLFKSHKTWRRILDRYSYLIIYILKDNGNVTKVIMISYKNGIIVTRTQMIKFIHTSSVAVIYILTRISYLLYWDMKKEFCSISSCSFYQQHTSSLCINKTIIYLFIFHETLKTVNRCKDLFLSL